LNTAFSQIYLHSRAEDMHTQKEYEGKGVKGPQNLIEGSKCVFFFPHCGCSIKYSSRFVLFIAPHAHALVVYVAKSSALSLSHPLSL